MSDATWKVQVSPRIGETLVNLRADTADEAERLLDWATANASRIAGAVAAFNLGAAGLNPTVVQLEQQPPAGWGPQPITSTQSQGPGPTCAHGPMILKTGRKNNKDWSGHFCPGPRGSQCEPVWPDKK